MTFLLFTLTAAKLCLYFAFVSLAEGFSRLLPAALAALALGPAAVACGSLAAGKKPLLRFAFLPLPFLALLLTRSPTQLLLLAPALLYPAAVLLTGRFRISYRSDRAHFLGSSACLIPLLLFSQLNEASLPPLFFGTGCLVLEVFTLRQLRFGLQTSRRRKSLELLSICSIPAGAGLAVFLLPRLLKAGEWLLKSGLYPLIQLLQKLVERLIAFLEPVIDSAATPAETQATVESTAAVTETYLPETVSAEFPIRLRSNLSALLIPLAVAAAVLFLLWFIRRLYQTRPEAALEEGGDPDTEADADAGPVRLPVEAERRSNRRKVRRIYEKYLKLLQRRSFHRQPQDSSGEILEKSRSLSAEEPARALRELYILARYHPDASITEAQVREAQRLLRRLREEPKEKSPK